MRLSRTGKLIRNLLLVLAVLVFLWCWEGQPLPLRMAYRRAEKGHFIGENRIVLEDRDEGRVISLGKRKLYLFSRRGWWLPENTIVTCPVEDGLAWGVFGLSKDPYTALTVAAYEAGETARTGRLRYTVTPMDPEAEPLVYTVEAEAQNGVFLFPIRYQNLTATKSGRPAIIGVESEYIEAMLAWKNGFRIGSDYTLTMEFYAADGSVTAAYSEEGGISHEDR